MTLEDFTHKTFYLISAWICKYLAGFVVNILLIRAYNELLILHYLLRNLHFQQKIKICLRIQLTLFDKCKNSINFR